jgi:hypothetical protein
VSLLHFYSLSVHQGVAGLAQWLDDEKERNLPEYLRKRPKVRNASQYVLRVSACMTVIISDSRPFHDLIAPYLRTHDGPAVKTQNRLRLWKERNMYTSMHGEYTINYTTQRQSKI